MSVSLNPDDLLDLSGVPCPANSARAILRLEWMDPGEVLEIIVDEGEPVANVPPSLEEEGHEIVVRQQDGEKWRLFVRRGED